jgi:RNA polymerase sigma factor (sigma-70 family)
MEFPIASGGIMRSEPASLTLSDEQLLAKFRTIIVDRSCPVRRFARRRADDRDHEDDLVQETLVRAWEKRGQLRDAGRLGPWLCRICRTITRGSNDHLLDASALPDAGDRESSSTTANAIGEQILFDERLMLICRLPPQQKAVVLSRLYRGLSIKETAQALRKSEGTVKATLSQARRTLRGQDPALRDARCDE